MVDRVPEPNPARRAIPQSVLVNIGLAILAGALVIALVVTGNPGVPPTTPDSGAQGSHGATTSTATTPQTTATTAPAGPTATAAPGTTLSAWNAKYAQNVAKLGTDEEGIDMADNALSKGGGGSSTHDYASALSAAQQLATDVEADQRLPLVPDTEAESYWSKELSYLAVAAATYYEGFTDEEQGNTADGATLLQQGGTQLNQAQSEGNSLKALSH